MEEAKGIDANNAYDLIKSIDVPAMKYRPWNGNEAYMETCLEGTFRADIVGG